MKETDLGGKLSEAYADRKKIILYVIVRLILVIVICLAGVQGIEGLKEWLSSLKGTVMFLVIVIPSILWGLFPLRHMKDELIFFENGLSLNGREYTFELLGKINFCDYTRGIKTEQYMNTRYRNFNVTYIYRPKRAFNEAYLNKI